MSKKISNKRFKKMIESTDVTRWLSVPCNFKWKDCGFALPVVSQIGDKSWGVWTDKE